MINFICGFILGAFVAQNYNIPNIKNIGTDILEHLKTMEKNESKESSKKK